MISIYRFVTLIITQSLNVTIYFSTKPSVTKPLVYESETPPKTEKPLTTPPPKIEKPLTTPPPNIEQPLTTPPPNSEKPLTTPPPETETPLTTPPPKTETPLTTPASRVLSKQRPCVLPHIKICKSIVDLVHEFV